MNAAPQSLPPARELGLVPGLPPEELRRIYRVLARRYHPDSGQTGSEAIMRHINVLYDELRAAARRPAPLPPETPPVPEAPSVSAASPPPDMSAPPAAPVHSASRPAPNPTGGTGKTTGGTPDELFFTRQARGLMSEALLDAVDRWLERAHRIPRSPVKRALLRRLGLITPVTCPGLHMPQRVSMTRDTLRFHFVTRPFGGPNLIALPVLSNHGLRLVPSGLVPVFEEELAPSQGCLVLSPEVLHARGFALTLDGRDLPVTLVFDTGGGAGSTGFYRLPEKRYRGLLVPAAPPQGDFRSPS